MKLVLAGDTMLGRGAAHVLARSLPSALFSDEVVAAFGERDLGFVNLECCISTRGRPWPDPAKPFFFRAPPTATKVLTLLGVDCVSLANNHALDFGTEALLDTFDHLQAAGIRWVGAGPDIDRARQPVVLEAAGLRLAIVAFTDHPAAYQAGRGRPGVAYATCATAPPAGCWTPSRPPPPRPTPCSSRPTGAPTCARHPAVCPAGRRRASGCRRHPGGALRPRVPGRTGPDPVRPWRLHRRLRRRPGAAQRPWPAVCHHPGPRPQRLEAIPIALDFCHTRLAAATGDEAAWVGQRFRSLCAEFGTEVTDHRGRLVIEWAESRTVEDDPEAALVPGGHVDNGDNGDDDPPDADNP